MKGLFLTLLPYSQFIIGDGKKIGLKLTDYYGLFSHVPLYNKHYLGNEGDGYSYPIKDSNENWQLSIYNKEFDKREYSMFVEFNAFKIGFYDPYKSISIEYWGYNGGVNFNRIFDIELLEAAKNMRIATNDDEYLNAWQKYQLRYNYLLPTIPLYSKIDYFIFSDRIENFNVTYDWKWTNEIIYFKI